MKSCKFVELRVLSHIQRAARTIQFGPDANVLLGPNDTGKSSIIKTLYWTLGAEPYRVSDKWQSLDVKALLRFSLDGEEHSILRDGPVFALFDSKDKLRSVYRSTTRQLAPSLARLFDFKLQLTGRDGQPATPTPAFLYLPFYVDQDGGWGAPWSSFAKLQQFKDWRRDTIEYHAGIKPNAYYVAKSEYQRLGHEAQEPRLKRQALNTLRDDVSDRLPPAEFSIDLDVYTKEIAELIERCRVLQAAEEEYKHKLSDIETRRAVIVAQQDIVRGVGKELDSDYAYAANLPETVSCPTCGEEYRNGFAERFAIAQDEDRCIQLASELSDELDKLEDERRTAGQRLSAVQNESEEANRLLASKQGDVTLQHLIRNEGRREVATLLDEEARALDSELLLLDSAIQAERDKMEKLSSRERRKEIVGAYREFMHSALLQLNVLSLPEKAYRSITSTLRATGSDAPRAVLAYVYTFLKLIVKSSAGTMFPIVVDAVNQQEQDDENLRRMLHFIRDDRPKDSQLILGLVDAKGVEFDGKIIRFEEKFAALRPADYGAVAEQMRPFIAATTQ